MGRTARFGAALAAALVIATACSAPRASAPTATPAGSGSAAASATPNFEGRTLNIVTGGTGAVYIVYGAGLADLLNKKLGTAASAQSTTASVPNSARRASTTSPRTATYARRLSRSLVSTGRRRPRWQTPRQPTRSLPPQADGAARAVSTTISLRRPLGSAALTTP